VHTRSLRIRYTGILLGESYIGIRTLANFSAIVIYNNRPSGIIAFLIATLASANKHYGVFVEDINLVAMLVSINKLSGAVAGERLLY
jgi:hypothetical protein